MLGVAFKGDAGIAAVLLDGGASVDAVGGGGRTALMMAARYGQEAVVEVLLARGADAGLCDDAGITAWSLADGQGHHAVAARLASGRQA